VKVVDFGVAKAENRAEKTKTGAVKGKISYLSPEQCRHAPIDRRSDLFSLGVVMWEMLTTERLYRRGSDFDDMTAIVTEQPLAPSVLRPGLAPEVDALTLRLLAKTPEERFQTADELIEAIEDIAKRHGALLSTTGLGRFMRELFGTKKEPWFDLASVQVDEAQLRDGVTVTSEPIPAAIALIGDEMPTVRARPKDMGAILAALPVVPQTQIADEPEPVAGQPPAWKTRVLTTARVAPLATLPPRRRSNRFWLAALLGVAAIACAAVAAIVIGMNGPAVVPQDAAAPGLDAARVAPDASAAIVEPIIVPDAAVIVDAAVEPAPVDAAVDIKTDKPKVPKRPKPPKKDCAKDPMACQH
jgi:hypothetical protein